MFGAEPVLGEAGVRGIGACLYRIQVAAVSGDPAAELGTVADVAVPRDDDVDAGDIREQPQARTVAAKRVGTVQVEQRNLDVGAHVADNQYATVGEEDRTVAGGVRVVRVDEGARARPVDLAADERLDPGEQPQVMAGRALFHLGDQAGLCPGRDRYRVRCRVPGRVAERP